MRPYPYLQKECRNGEERRKSRVTDVIIFKYIDRTEYVNENETRLLLN